MFGGLAAGGKGLHKLFVFAQMPYLPETLQESHKHWCVEPKSESSKKVQLCWTDQADGHSFVAAMNRMIWENSPRGKAQREATQRAFDQQLAAWRANGSKIEVPEEAQRHYVLSQQAFQEKNFGRQADELSAVLEIYPTWPEQQFDLALVLAELNRYAEAIQHMQMYLELSPEAPDAQKAKQQIWIWQDKEKRGSN